MSVRIAQFRQKLAASPHNDLFRFSLAQSLFENGEFDEAITLFFECFEKKPDWMLVTLFLGKAFIEKDNHQEAARFLNLTIKTGSSQNHEGPVEEARQLLSSIERSSQ